jgi:DNA-binding CsgD family transcriptional regulator
VADVLPVNFDERFSACFAEHIWPLLCPGSSRKAFSATEPLRLLAHNLDFWLPYLDLAAQELVRSWGRTRVEDERQQKKIEKVRGMPKPPEYPEYTVERPLHGGYIWSGEEEAWEVTRRVVELADESGKLRGIIDAVRSHRVEDDFSSKWSPAKEDFERKLYRKRSKTRVTFVELDDTIPVYGPDSEVELDRKLFWEDLIALLDPKERHVVVLLRSGHTQSEIAAALGYQNHSPISKALKRILRKAQRLLGS